MKSLSRTLIETPVPYYLCTKEEEFNILMKRYGVQSLGGASWLPATGGATTYDFNEAIIVNIDGEFDHSAEDVLVLLIHEGVHVWQHMEQNFFHNESTMEMEAYAIDNITFNLITEYRKKRPIILEIQ